MCLSTKVEMRMRRNSVVPLYQQLADTIRQQIADNALKPGDRILTEAELSEKFEVSRITVRKAIDQLVEEDVVVRKQGIGTFVAEKKLHRVMRNQVISFTEMCQLSGGVPSSELISAGWVKADPSVGNHLGVAPQERIIKIVRVRKIDGLPVMLETSYYPQRAAFLLQENLTGSTYQAFRAHDLIPSHGKKTFEICKATAKEAALLDTAKNQPLLLQEDTVTDQNGEILHYTKLVINSDRYRLTVIT